VAPGPPGWGAAPGTKRTPPPTLTGKIGGDVYELRENADAVSLRYTPC
jgi:hypothetical protein